MQRFWVAAVMIEHGVMLVRVMLMRLTPDSPTWVANARDRMEFRYNQWTNGAEKLLQAGKTINQIHDEIYSWDAGD